MLWLKIITVGMIWGVGFNFSDALLGMVLLALLVATLCVLIFQYIRSWRPRRS